MEIRDSLCMLGVPIDGPALMVGDNMSVVLNVTVPSSQLKKKHNAIAFHRIREAHVAKIPTMAHCESERNIADVLTKPLPGPRFMELVKRFIFRKPRAMIEASVGQAEENQKQKTST